MRQLIKKKENTEHLTITKMITIFIYWISFCFFVFLFWGGDFGKETFHRYIDYFI